MKMRIMRAARRGFPAMSAAPPHQGNTPKLKVTGARPMMPKVAADTPRRNRVAPRACYELD
jgi:hypothetical protein